MPESMSITVNGQSHVPPGFRFQPTEEELLQYYLKKKVSYQKIDLDVIRDVDLNKLEPWEIQEICRIGTTPQKDWYFFSHKDKKYPTGTRTNRATAAGFWKATGRDKVIRGGRRGIGMRKTLVFYKGRAPHGQKSDWIMYEYRLQDDNTNNGKVQDIIGEVSHEEGWVVCRIFKKKNLHKTLESPIRPSSQMLKSCNDGDQDQILQNIGGSSCKEEHEDADVNYGHQYYHENSFMQLPSVEGPNSTGNEDSVSKREISCCTGPNSVYPMDCDLNANWIALHRLVASQLNGPSPTMAYCPPASHHYHYDDLQFPTLGSYLATDIQDYNNENELWNSPTKFHSF